jgi:hypothetical protein
LETGRRGEGERLSRDRVALRGREGPISCSGSGIKFYIKAYIFNREDLDQSSRGGEWTEERSGEEGGEGREGKR